MRTTATNVVRLTPAEAPPRQTIAKAAAASDRPAKVYEVRADRPVGLLLRVMPSGLRTYYVQIGRGKRVRIGEAGPFTLKQAIERANGILRNPEAATKKKADGITLSEYVTQHYGDHSAARLKNGSK